MLKILRKKGVAKKILWVVAVIIIISFGFFGTAYLFKSPSYAGELFGKKISKEDFEKIYQSTRIQAIVRYGDSFYQIQPFLDLESDTWDRLILLHEAEKRGIKATDQEVITTIEQYPFFKRNEQFDNSLYVNIIQNILHVKEREFEESVRDSIKFSKIFEQETSHVAVLDEEAFEAYKKKNEKVQVTYIFIDPQKFKNPVIATEEELKEYFTQNQLEFFIPTLINVEYILLPLEETEGEESSGLRKKKAETLRKEMANNPDLKSIAQKYDLDVKMSGFFSLEQPDLSLGWSYDILNQIFELAPDEIAGPLETEKGFTVLKIKERKEAHMPEFLEVKDKVKEALAGQGAKKIALEKASDYLNIVREEYAKSNLKDFPAIVKNLNLELAQTPVFARGQYLPQVGLSKEFQEAAFGLTEENKISDVVEILKGYCILYLDSYVAVDSKQFEDEKETFRGDLLNARKNEIFSDFLIRLRLEANLADKLTNRKPTP